MDHYGVDKMNLLADWQIDEAVISSFRLEMAFSKWPVKTWADQSEPPEQLIDEMTQALVDDHKYNGYLIGIDRANGGNKRLIEYMDLNQKELILCEQIGRNY